MLNSKCLGLVLMSIVFCLEKVLTTTLQISCFTDILYFSLRVKYFFWTQYYSGEKNVHAAALPVWYQLVGGDRQTAASCHRLALLPNQRPHWPTHINVTSRHSSGGSCRPGVTGVPTQPRSHSEAAASRAAQGAVAVALEPAITGAGAPTAAQLILINGPLSAPE